MLICRKRLRNRLAPFATVLVELSVHRRATNGEQPSARNVPPDEKKMEQKSSNIQRRYIEEDRKLLDRGSEVSEVIGPPPSSYVAKPCRLVQVNIHHVKAASAVVRRMFVIVKHNLSVLWNLKQS